MFDELIPRSGLSLDRLHNFLAVAKAGSIAKAAPHSPVRQSQISRQIRELEEFFKAELTQRHGKTLILTVAGKNLAKRIYLGLTDLDDFRKEQSEAKRTFTVAAGASILDWLVIPVIGSVRDALNKAIIRFDTRRSEALVEGVRYGEIDFAIVREDAIAPKLPRLPLLRLKFYLCVPRCLVKRGKTANAIDDPSLWKTLPFTAGIDGGQFDRTLRQAMEQAVGKFQPMIECNSMLQIRQIIERGVCAGILPSVGIQGLCHKEILISEFALLKNYGRPLALHWNERQMRRRGVQKREIEQIAAAIKSCTPFNSKQI